MSTTAFLFLLAIFLALSSDAEIMRKKQEAAAERKKAAEAAGGAGTPASGKKSKN